MSQKAHIEVGGKKIELPVLEGSEKELAIDIGVLRSATGGLTTIDPGFKNTGSGQSAITFLDGEHGVLHYRGYAIDELAEKANFLEVAYLLIFGELPTRDQLQTFLNDIKEHSIFNLPTGLKNFAQAIVISRSI